MNTNKKYSFNNIRKVFIVSAGRTGTKFFGKNMVTFVPNSVSVHEPDKVSFQKGEGLLNNIKRQGVIDLFFLKSLGVTGGRNLSLHALKGEKSDRRILQSFLYSRAWVKDCNYYFESNSQLFGLTGLLSKIPNTKIIILFRDPRDWVRSWMNKGYWYDNKDILSKLNFLGLKRLDPKNVGIHLQDWLYFSRFQKLCWVWNYMNSNLTHSLDRANVMSFTFEDLFISKDFHLTKNMFDFIFEHSQTEKYVNEFMALTDNKVNQTVFDTFPHWKQWSDDQCRTLHSFCGDLMVKLGYGSEPEWMEKVNDG